MYVLPLHGMLVNRRVTPSIKFSGTHLYTWVERGIVRVTFNAHKCISHKFVGESPEKIFSVVSSEEVEVTKESKRKPISRH